MNYVLIWASLFVSIIILERAGLLPGFSILLVALIGTVVAFERIALSQRKGAAEELLLILERTLKNIENE